MNLKYFVSLAMIHMILISSAEKAYSEGAPFKALRPFLNVPRLEQAPTIDGVIAEREWIGASLISGFMGATGTWSGKVTPHESRIYLAHDGSRLYMAVFVELPPGVKPSMNYRRRDEPVYMDNYQLELWLTPPVVDRSTSYQMIGNAYGAIYDNRQIPDLGVSNVQWNGNWEFKNSYATGEYWMAELAIDLNEFSDQPITPDALWRGMIGVAWPQRSWPYTFGWYKNVDTHAHLRFSDGGDAVQVTDLRGFFNNTLAPEIILINSQNAEQTFTLEFEGRGKTWTETVSVPADTRKTVRFEYELPAFPLRGRPEGVRVTIRNGKQDLLLDGDWYYTPAELSEVTRIPAKPESWKMLTRMQFAPDAMGVRVWADVLDFPQRSALDRVRFVVRAPGGEVVQEETVRAFNHDAAEAYLWMPKNLPFGRYAVEMVFQDAAGNDLASDSKNFNHQDLTERFVWIGNDLGKTTTIHPPFEPVQNEKNGVLKVWGRNVGFHGAFPDQISSQGRPLLRDSVNLIAVVNGKKMPAVMTTPFEVTSEEETIVTFSGAYEVAGLKVSLEGRMEYDGMIYYNLDASPLSGETGESVERVYLSIPMVAQHAEYYFTTRGGWSPGFGLTASDLPGEVTVWDSSEFADFVPYVGLVDDHIGLQWFADQDHHWVLGRDAPSSQIVRRGETVEIQVNFVRKSGPVPAFQAKFGLIAFPVRAMPSNWRNTVLDDKPLGGSTINFFYGPGHGNTNIDLHDTRKLAKVLGVEVGDRNPDQVLTELEPQAPRLNSLLTPERIREFFKKNEIGSVSKLKSWLQHSDVQPHSTRLCYFYNAKMYFEGNRSEAFRTFFPGEWVLDPPSGWFHLTPTESYQDFFAFHLNLWFKHWIVPGLYFDEVYLAADRNVFNGNGKIMEDGTIRPTFPLMRQRAYLNRMRQLFIDNQQEPFIWVHTSNYMAAYAISSVDIAMFGEDRTPSPATDIIDTTPAMLLRSIGRSQKFGFVPVWMTMAGRGGSSWGLAGRQTLGWYWQHDVVPEIHPVQRGRHLATLRAGWGIGADDVSFVPYWNTGGAMKTGDEEIIASAWIRPDGRALIQVMNLNHENAKDAVITLNSEKLGLPATFAVLDLESDPVSKRFLAAMEAIDRLQQEDRNASVSDLTQDENNIQNRITYDPSKLHTLSENASVSLTIAPRNFRTFIVEPR